MDYIAKHYLQMLAEGTVPESKKTELYRKRFFEKCQKIEHSLPEKDAKQYIADLVDAQLDWLTCACADAFSVGFRKMGEAIYKSVVDPDADDTDGIMTPIEMDDDDELDEYLRAELDQEDENEDDEQE